MVIEAQGERNPAEAEVTEVRKAGPALGGGK